MRLRVLLSQVVMYVQTSESSTVTCRLALVRAGRDLDVLANRNVLLIAAEYV